MDGGTIGLTMITKILIVDDHAIVRRGLSMTIREVFPAIEVHEASSVGRAINVMSAYRDIGMALIDISLPGSDGRLLIPKVKELLPDAKVIIISASDDHATVQSVIDAGANGFISKSYESTQLVEELDLYLNGTLDYCKSGEGVQLNSQAPGTSTPPIDKNKMLSQYSLSKRQAQIAELLQKGFTNKEISDALFLSEGTIKNYISQLFDKLEVSSRTQAVIKLNAG